MTVLREADALGRGSAGCFAMVRARAGHCFEVGDAIVFVMPSVAVAQSVARFLEDTFLLTGIPRTFAVAHLVAVTTAPTTRGHVASTICLAILQTSEAFLVEPVGEVLVAALAPSLRDFIVAHEALIIATFRCRVVKIMLHPQL